ncbi:MAG: phenylalanine--tRNA ligase subunit beta [Candidatus Cloacimonetes bacterium]|nr:phenylalanine--tRNA ligase subunit beta [Candidatus Cloacimonadota bacterium]
MKISYNWLKKYIGLSTSAEDLTDLLTFIGIEVEAIEEIGKFLQQIKVAKIVNKQKHPDADKLSICTVFDGIQNINIVCGAPNCATNQKVALAPVGTDLGSFKIKKTKIRGVESCGMLCSEKELGLTNNHDGILVLPDSAVEGTSLADFFEIKDVVYDVEITPNRPDLLGMIGVARDIAAKLNLTVNYPNPKLSEGKERITDLLELENRNSSECTRYLARVIKGVTVRESPMWLQNTLRAVGIKPINNIVDVSNYVMMEYGHPLHAFDYDKIIDRKIVVRNAQAGENISALDNFDYELISSDLVIADTKKPIALAGIIGGSNSHITNETVNIVIESANFKYSTVRKTASRLKINTDSSYRFERNMSDENAVIASVRAAELILALAGGELAEGSLDSYPSPNSQTSIVLRIERANKLLSLDLSADTIISFLIPLGLVVTESSEEIITFLIPHFRKDLEREIDLIEEIIRLHGYNKVGQKTFPQKIMNRKKFYLRRNLQDFLIQRGFFEVVNWPFSDPEDLDRLKLSGEDDRKKCIFLKNPLGTRFSIMQTSLLPNLLKNSLHNINHGVKSFRLFELTKVYLDKSNTLATEEYHLSFVMTGNLQNTFWREKESMLDFFDLKGLSEDLLEFCGIYNFVMSPISRSYYHPGLAVSLSIDEDCFGEFGKLDAKVLEDFGIEQEFFYFDINLERIINHDIVKTKDFIKMPKYPDVQRDISFIVSKDFHYSEIRNSIISVSPKLISNVVLFDEYKGKGINEGCRSLSISLTLSSDNNTLTDEICNKTIDKIFAKLTQDFAIEKR